MATHSGILAWRIPGTEETGGLQSMGSQRVRHDWRDSAQHPKSEQNLSQGICGFNIYPPDLKYN